MTMTPDSLEDALRRVHKRANVRASRRRIAAAVVALALVGAAVPIVLQMRFRGEGSERPASTGFDYLATRVPITEGSIEAIAVGPTGVWVASTSGDGGSVSHVGKDHGVSSYPVPGTMIELLPLGESLWMSTGTYAQELEPDGTLGRRTNEIGWATVAIGDVVWGLADPSTVGGYDTTIGKIVATIDLHLDSGEHVVAGLQRFGEDLVTLASSDSGGRLIIIDLNSQTASTFATTASAPSHIAIVGEEVWVPRWGPSQTTFDRYSLADSLSPLTIDGQVTPIGETGGMLWAIGRGAENYQLLAFSIDDGTAQVVFDLPNTPAHDGSGAVDPASGLVAVANRDGSVTIASRGAR